MMTVNTTANTKKLGMPLVIPPPMKNRTGNIIKKTIMTVIKKNSLKFPVLLANHITTTATIDALKLEITFSGAGCVNNEKTPKTSPSKMPRNPRVLNICTRKSLFPLKYLLMIVKRCIWVIS